MNLTQLQPRSLPPVAHLGGTHGYRLEGDLAHLNAEILCDESRLTGQLWALQLWTDEGIRITELPLGLLQPNGSGCIHVLGTATALPPASRGPHIVSMVLVSGTADRLDTVEDVASYIQPMTFVQPRLQGTVCSGFTDDQITFDIARIENPRDTDNVSGTLALELWALDAPYTGGAWTGIPVASLVLGTLNGQEAWTDSRYTTHAGPLPANGHLTLMLREWTPAGYVTRDYRALARPSISPVAAEAPHQAKVAAKTTPASPTQAAPAKATVVAKEAPATGAVSINTASAAELKSVKGISEGLARAIVASRPYISLDEVIRAKGMGSKLFAKVRAGLKL